jgi:crotonobetainyl-CoA:carnitine CoA-transferase CaiB-like acyl-CoA transferase
MVIMAGINGANGESNGNKGPLSGMRVIELCHVMAGPVCGLMLADMGADVIKVERPPHGDDTRKIIPPTIGGESAAFMMMNRNKRGVAIDLKTDAGRKVLRKLIATADVLTENFRPGTLDRLGLSYETLSKDNPGLIYCAVSGFGRTGPYAERGGFDLVAQSMSGIMSVTGEGPGRPPMKCGPPLTDITAGILAAMGVAAAYAQKLQTGKGCMVDTSLFEAGIVHTYWQSAICFARGVSPGPLGSGHPLSAPYQAFPASDGWLTIGASNQSNWLRLVEAIGAPELAQNERFLDNGARMANLPQLVEVLTQIFQQRTVAEWLVKLERAGVPAGPVLDVAQMHADPQTLARKMVVDVAHPRHGSVKTIGAPVKFSGMGEAIRRAAPALGEHTEEVLAEIGIAPGESGKLAAEGAVTMASA